MRRSLTLDSEGTVLGYANVNEFTQDGETFTNTSYNDANWNWLGSSYSDPYGSGYNSSQEVTADGDVAIDLDGDDIPEFTIADGTAYRVEKGGHKESSRPEDPYESEYEFYYDANWNLLGGMDKFDNGATITIYDENWNATTSVDEAAVFANLTLTDVDESAFDALPSDFLKAIGVDTETSTSETVNITVTVDATTDTDNPVFLFAADENPGTAINPDSDTFNEGDVYVFDVSGLGDYSFVLASDAAGTTPLTAGVVTSADGNTITYTVPAGEAVEDGSTGVHIVGFNASSEVVASLGTDGTNTVPYTDVINPPALQSSTERYDWGDGSETTYVLGGTILGYSETSAVTVRPPTQTQATTTAIVVMLGSYSNQWGEGSHFMLVAIDTTGDVTGTENAEYIQEFGKSINVFEDGDGGTVREEREWTYNYEKLDGDAGGNYGGAPAAT